MNQKHSKLQHQQREEQTTHLQQAAKARAAREFESIEQILHEDASATCVPPAVEERLSQSVQQNPKPQRSWWNRWRKR